MINGKEIIENFCYGLKNIYNKDKDRLENYPELFQNSRILIIQLINMIIYNKNKILKLTQKYNY